MNRKRHLLCGMSSALLVVSCISSILAPMTARAQSVKADKILVLKSRRTLMLLRDGTILRRYHISLGRQPDGPKMRRGDGRTPEGVYTIDKRNAFSRFHLALHVSYPSSADLYRCRRMGTDPGGNIMIHGLPNGHGPRWTWKSQTDWTAGCIAVTDRDIEEIWRAAPDGVVVEIRS